MKTLDDNFVVDPESTAERLANETKRRLECKFESQCRQLKPVTIKHEPVAINPIADLLKGLKV